MVASTTPTFKPGTENILTEPATGYGNFLSNFGSNPSYELQLSYGTLAGSTYECRVKARITLYRNCLDWCFNRGDLRGWGAIVGKWGGYDVSSGLIGEANDAGNDYAFVMNGFQQAAALAPLLNMISVTLVPLPNGY